MKRKDFKTLQDLITAEGKSQGLFLVSFEPYGSTNTEPNPKIYLSFWDNRNLKISIHFRFPLEKEKKTYNKLDLWIEYANPVDELYLPCNIPYGIPLGSDLKKEQEGDWYKYCMTSLESYPETPEGLWELIKQMIEDFKTHPFDENVITRKYGLPLKSELESA